MISAALAAIHARKWVVELIILAAIAGIVWWGCYHLIEVGVQRQRDNDAKELARVVAEARVHETTIAKEASDAYETKLAAIRSTAPIGAVRLCHSPKPVLTSTTAPGQPDAATGERQQGTIEDDPGPDIGPALDAYGGDCAAVGARLEALQSWVKSR